MASLFMDRLIKDQIEKLLDRIDAADGTPGNVTFALLKTSASPVTRGQPWSGSLVNEEADFSGYARHNVELTDFSTVADDGTGWWTGTAQITWEFDSGEGSTSNTIQFVALLIDIGSGLEPFAVWELPDPKSMGADGDVIKFTPKIRAQNPPWPV